MQKKILFSILVLSIAFSAFAQQLPLNTCGIVNIYDAAGNRTKRVYFCNNGTDPYPSKANNQSAANEVMEVQAKETTEFQMTDALYPNPTTGTFFITFSKALQNAMVLLTDVHGKTIQKFKASGYKVDFNLSSVAAGVYFVKINDHGNVISKKVVKQQ